MILATMLKLAAAASSDTIYGCSSEDVSGGVKYRYLSGPFQLPGASKEEAEAAFKAHLEQKFGIRYAFVGCSYYKSLEQAQENTDWLIQMAPGRSAKVVMVPFGQQLSKDNSGANAESKVEEDTAASATAEKPAAPSRPKKSNAQADAEYAAAMAEYHR